ncbi:oxidoreductase [Pseudomonas chlororaphis]|uniref:Short-chain dehydrogenase/reductase n=1 Tax=Pseudomonas chlororaphis TaxID=587753 RepID=A0A1Q8EUV1_9PSED|nr:oxidoreductase [Pseudomonas chlororaphis]OLF55563.1 short-chain dehydrogenase/reductase [Pseudomonas chlororaphis]
MSKVWLITGSASGLGRNIAEAVLAAGDRLVATARQPRQLDDLVRRYGDRVRAVALDVTDSAAAKAAVQVAIGVFGRLDVLVNNAGYGQLSAFEQTSEEAFRAEVETNLFGVVNLSRAALPFMRAQRSGHILQISSVGGRVGIPGLSAYQSAKWAVGGFTEVLAQEVASLGIKVCALEPGGMRTNWGVRARQKAVPVLEEYQASVGSVNQMLSQYVGHEAGDPDKVAQIVLKLAYHPKPPVHLLIGSDALQYAGAAESDRAAAAERWREVSAASDFAATGPLPAFPVQ